MNTTTRQQRLVSDLKEMQGLRTASTVLEFETDGQPPERYNVTFRGKGLERNATTGDVAPISVHQCELRLALSYPDHPPDVRWLTPLFHPNISFGGFIRLEDIGVPWSDGPGLDVICERLWDVARLAYYDLDTATNYVAKKWLQEQHQFSLPLDTRPLRDKAMSANSNVIRYRRRTDREPTPTEEDTESNVLYIDENTPEPSIELGRPSRAGDSDDVLYIGDE
jgi:ubiquitin-protein ligase